MIASDIPIVAGSDLAWITETDMIEVDRAMIEDLHIDLIQMMENAGRALARVIIDAATPTTVAIAAGSGGNGGGGLVAARHLANAGIDVVVATTRERQDMSKVAAHQLDILERMGIERVANIPQVDLIVDAIIGYSLRGAPRGESERFIDELADANVVVSLDNPSGVNVTTGETPGVAASADATVTLALPKIGLRDSLHVGELYLADISVPPAVTRAFGSSAPKFGSAGLLRVTTSYTVAE